MTTTTEPADTEPTIGQAGAGLPLYPQTKLRIVALYWSGSDRAELPAGMPENVEIELNELPDTDLTPFVRDLVDALFRKAPDGANASISHHHITPAAFGHPAEVSS